MIDSNQIYDGSIFKPAVDLLEKNFSRANKVLVYGANGWLGRTAVALFAKINTDLLLIGRKASNLIVYGENREIKEYDIELIKDFSPTVYIDAAFLTRNFIGILGQSEYEKQNLDLIHKSKRILELPSVQKVLQFSSGVSLNYENNTVNNRDPYSFLKWQLEKEGIQILKDLDRQYSIVRLWSISGALVKNPKGYLFSDLISQAISGHIKINSKYPVFRRYSLAEEVLVMAILEAKYKNKILDSGGYLVDNLELTKCINQSIDYPVNFEYLFTEQDKSDHYYSDNVDWINFVNKYNYSAASLIEQINLVYKYFKKFHY